MKQVIIYFLLISFALLFFLSDSSAVRTVEPTVVNPEKIKALPEVGVLNPSPISSVSAMNVVDIDQDGYDEVVFKCGDIIDLNTFSGQKIRRLWFPISLHGWNVLNVDELGGCCLFIFREVENWARLEVYDTDKNLLGSINLCPVKDRDGSGWLDFSMQVLGMLDFDGDDKKELIIRARSGYDLYPRGLFVVDLKRWRLVRENYTAGNVKDIHFIDIDSDNLPDMLISTCAPSNDAVVGDWDDSQGVLLAIRGLDGSVIWRRVIGGPLSWIQHRLIDLEGDGGDEILVAEFSEFAGKEHNTMLRAFKLPGAVEFLSWECSNPNIIIDCFAAWGSGENCIILAGFNDGTLVKFSPLLIPSPLFRFPGQMSFIHGVDLNGDGRKETLVGFKDEQVVVLDNRLRLVGRQHFCEPPVPVRTTDVEFGDFAVISEGRVCGWSVGGVRLMPPPSGFAAWLQRWGWYAGIVIILLAAAGWITAKRIRKSDVQIAGEASEESLVRVTDFAGRVLVDMECEDVRKTICNEILSRRKGLNSFDYLVFLLGDVEIYDGSGEVKISHWRGVKWKALFCYLVANRMRRIHKEKLLDLFWQDSEPKQASQNLRLAIHRLNRELSLPAKGRFFIISDQCYSINSEYELFVDVREFERLVPSADRLMKDGQLEQAVEYYLTAIRLYSDDYLMNLYESWCDDQRGYAQKLYIHAQKQVGRYLLNNKMLDSAIGYFKNALKIDEYSEELYIDIMRCHAANGNRKAIKEEYQHLVKLLREEMDTDPLPETARIYHSLIS